MGGAARRRSRPTRRRTSRWPAHAPPRVTSAARCVQLERLEQALHRELGAAPGPAAVRLRTELEQSTAAARERPAPTRPADGAPAVRLFGRRDVGDRIRAGPRRGRPADVACTVLVRARPGSGKSAVLDLAEPWRADRAGRSRRGGASSVEGPWPYAPVLEALSALCRRHPALLDALGDDYRTEIERALSGRDLGWTGESSHQRLFVAAAELMRVAAAGPGLLLVVDDVHEADEASLRLLHYLSRCAIDERVRPGAGAPDPAPSRVRDVLASLVSRGGGHRVELRPLDHAARRSACSWTGSPSWTRPRPRRSCRRRGSAVRR